MILLPLLEVGFLVVELGQKDISLNAELIQRIEFAVEELDLGGQLVVHGLVFGLQVADLLLGDLVLLVTHLGDLHQALLQLRNRVVSLRQCPFQVGGHIHAIALHLLELLSQLDVGLVYGGQMGPQAGQLLVQICDGQLVEGPVHLGDLVRVLLLLFAGPFGGILLDQSLS